MLIIRTSKRSESSVNKGHFSTTFQTDRTPALNSFLLLPGANYVNEDRCCTQETYSSHSHRGDIDFIMATARTWHACFS